MQIGCRADKKPDVYEIVVSVIVALLLYLCPVPAFMHIGKLPFQLLSSLLFPAVITGFTMLSRNPVRIIGRALKFYVYAYIITGFVVQLFAQIKAGTAAYQYAFYYDKPLCVMLCWGSVFLLIVLWRSFSQISVFSPSYKSDFSFFVKESCKAFWLLYFLLLVMFFVVIRTYYGTDISVNFIPFHTIRSYFSSGLSYENFMFFFGNLFIFSPLGFLLKIYKPNTNKIIIGLLPVIISCAIEASQLLLANGDCDIDDLLLNCVGFYFGVTLKYLLDLLHQAVTHGGERTIFDIS